MGDNIGKRRLPQSRRPVEQNVLNRFAALLSCLDKDIEVALRLFLPYVISKALGSEGIIERTLLILLLVAGADHRNFGLTGAFLGRILPLFAQKSKNIS